MELMDISKELAFINKTDWNNPELKASAINLIVAYKTISDYAQYYDKTMNEVTIVDLISSFIAKDYSETLQLNSDGRVDF
jgi:hypothetical protein